MTQGTMRGSQKGRQKSPTGRTAEPKVVPLHKKHGGPRPNSGRKPGSGKYGEATQLLRVPVSLKDEVIHYVSNKGFNLPVYAMKVPMGLMKSSIDYVERTLNLNELIKHPSQTFFHPVEGDSMEPTVFSGDLAMIDSAVEPMHGDVVLALIEGGLTLKRLVKIRKRVWLDSDNKKYDPIILNAEIENSICGVMLVAIRPVSLNHIKPF